MQKFRRLWFFGVLISAYLGVAASYSKVYLVHLFLALAPVFFFKKITSKEIFLAFLKKNWIFLFWISYFFLSLLWAENSQTAMTYNVMVLLGTLVAMTLSLEEKEDLRIWKVLGALTVASFVLGLVEAFTKFQYPISKYSSNLAYFKKTIVETDISVLYPTSFFWTANNFSFILIVSLPFYSLIKNKWQQITMTLVTLILIARTSSRGIMALTLAYLLYRIIHSSFKGKEFKKVFILVVSSCLIFIPVLYYTTTSDNVLEMKTVHDVLYKQAHFYTSLVTGNENFAFPRTRRDEMLYQAIGLWRQHKFFGAGAGQLQGKFGQFDGKPLDVSTPHHYWAELLAYGGLFFLGVFFVWVVLCFRKLKLKPAKEALVLFILAAPACSTLVYFFPAWMFLGLINRLSKTKEL